MSNPSEVLNGLRNDTLQDLYLKEHQDERGNKLNKKKMINSITDAIESSGVKNLLANIKRDDLTKVAEGASLELKEKDNAKSKAVLTKKLSAAIAKEGINDFLNEHCNVEVLKIIAAEMDVDESDKKEELVEAIGDAVRKVGMETYFDSFDVDQLQDVAEDLGLKTHRTSNKRKLVECIVNKKDAPKEPKAKKAKVEFSKKKKAIQKGTTYEDIFQHYYVGEVRDWCKEHGLKTSGKKGVLIKRILAFLDGDEESTKAKPKSSGGKAKSNGKAEKETKGEAKEEEEEEEGEEKKSSGKKKGGK